MKLLRLKKGEPAYIVIPKTCTLSVQSTEVTKDKEKMILVRVI